MSRTSLVGFTLAELLIALALLGVIATFTIPKILNAQQSSASLAKAKEVAAMISGAYQQAQAAGNASSSTKPGDLTQYMNYVKLDTSGTLIGAYPSWAGTAGGGTNACDATRPCLILHNGGLQLNDAAFGGQTSRIKFNFF